MRVFAATLMQAHVRGRAQTQAALAALQKQAFRLRQQLADVRSAVQVDGPSSRRSH